MMLFSLLRRDVLKALQEASNFCPNKPPRDIDLDLFERFLRFLSLRLALVALESKYQNQFTLQLKVHAKFFVFLANCNQL